jgi:hypothetical protein
MTTTPQKARGRRVEFVAKSKWLGELDLLDRRRPATPLVVKVALVVLMINLLVAAMMLMKLRAPHLG